MTSEPQDICLAVDAKDTISSLRWSPTSNHLAVTSWDGMMRVYDVAGGGAARGVASITADGPVFTCGWNKDGSIIAASGADKQVRLLHCPTGQTTIIGAHDAPVRSLCFGGAITSHENVIATGSWDHTVRYWDIRSPPGTPLATLRCAERVYAMDAAGPLLVVATAGSRVHLVDLRANPAAFATTLESPLKHQTTSVAASPDGTCFALSSIEGRCAIHAASKKDDKTINFTFRCHRDKANSRGVVKVWPVNDVCFHPLYPNVFSTAGSDGIFAFWDRSRHQRLMHSPAAEAAITASGFNGDGSLFAYGVGYDWMKGHAGHKPNSPVKLMVHAVKEEEVKLKEKK